MMTRQELPSTEGPYNVWVDGSQRTCPKFFNIHAKKAEEAIALILSGNVKCMSLGQTLPGQVRDAVDVAAFIERHAIDGGYKFQVVIHEKNAEIKDRIMVHLKGAMRSWIGHKQEIVHIDNSKEAWFAIMALALQNNNAKIPESGSLEINFTVNGRPVSFTDTVKEIHQRMTSHIQEQAAKLAHKQICDKYLKLENTLKQANQLVRDKIYEQFGLPISNLP